MRASAVLGLSLAALATSSPIEARQDTSGNTFNVSNFVFGCTVTCDWSFDVTVSGSQTNHPALTTAVTCSGSTTDKDFVECTEIGNGNTRYVAAYITGADQLRLKYHVSKPKQGAYYEFVFLHSNVDSADRLSDTSATGTSTLQPVASRRRMSSPSRRSAPSVWRKRLLLPLSTDDGELVF